MVPPTIALIQWAAIYQKTIQKTKLLVFKKNLVKVLWEKPITQSVIECVRVLVGHVVELSVTGAVWGCGVGWMRWMRRWLGLAQECAGGGCLWLRWRCRSMCTLQFRVLTNWLNKITENQKIYDSTLRFFSMLEILEIYIGYLPLKNSLLHRYRKYGIELNVTAPVWNHWLYRRSQKGSRTIRPRRVKMSESRVGRIFATQSLEIYITYPLKTVYCTEKHTEWKQKNSILLFYFFNIT